VHNVLAVRRTYIAKRWRMEAPAPLELPVFDMDAYYDQTTNSLIVSSSVFSWPLYAPRSAEGAPAEMYGRLFGAVTRALAQVLTSRGRSTAPTGCILDPTYWISSTRVLDRASFTSNQHCIADQVTEHTHVDTRLSHVADEMVANNIALRVAYHALTTDKRIKEKGLTHQVIKRFFLSWAQTQCLKIGDVSSRYQSAGTVEDLQMYYITLPLRNLNEWRVLYQCDQVAPTCDFFM
jgi:predicted metalloendopeptidase